MTGPMPDGVERRTQARISAVINTFNEERRLPYALRSVRDWVDEIVVVDMHSDDRTVDIARTFGAAVYQHDRLGYADPARAFAVSKATGNWILMLDADELVTPRLADRLVHVAEIDECDVVAIPFVNYLLGRPLGHTGWGPAQDRHERFFKPAWVDLTSDVHAYLRVREGARQLSLPVDDAIAIIHFNYVDVGQFVEKLNRYTTFEADRLVRERPERSVVRGAAATIREFVRRFVVKRGYRDGWRGFYLSGMMAFYRFTAHAKAQERTSAGSASEIEAFYAAEAERWLSGRPHAR